MISLCVVVNLRGGVEMQVYNYMCIRQYRHACMSILTASKKLKQAKRNYLTVVSSIN